MLKRKFYDFLVQWKQKKKKKCLLVKGARQVGKTYIIDAFGRENYSSYIYMNFLEHPEYKDIFEESLAAEEIYRRISLYIPKIRFIPGDTLLFLDEIQECPNARTAMKFMALDERFDIIASGSLLGILFKGIASIPVGYEQQIVLRSLDFEEFLWAVGIREDTIDHLRENFINREKTDPLLNEKMLEYLRIYMAVGGMQEAVNTYLSSVNYYDVYSVQNDIITSYNDDVIKYASTYEKPKIKACFESIPRQLSKENTKFQYSVVHKGDTNKKYGNSIDWLVDANLVERVYNVSLPEFPLRSYEKPEQFKIYVHDIGLLTAMFGYEMKAALINDTLTGPAKGGIYENLILSMLLQRGLELHYYKSENNAREIEFLFEKDGRIIPIEVKSHRGRTVSLDSFIEQYHPPYAYKLISGNSGVCDEKVTFPLYMAMFI